jgi:hypothetical protein
VKCTSQFSFFSCLKCWGVKWQELKKTLNFSEIKVPGFSAFLVNRQKESSFMIKIGK